METLEKRRDQLCEYVDNISNVQLLENYLHYFYESTEYLWDYRSDSKSYLAVFQVLIAGIY